MIKEKLEIMDQLIRYPSEGYGDADYKTALGILDTDTSRKNKQLAALVKDISGLANTAGGYLIYGIKEVNKTVFEPVGLSANEVSCFDPTVLTSRIQPFLSSLPLIESYRREMDEKQYGVLYVHPFREAPCIVKESLNSADGKTTYIRPGEIYVRDRKKMETVLLKNHQDILSLINRSVRLRQDEIVSQIKDLLPRPIKDEVNAPDVWRSRFSGDVAPYWIDDKKEKKEKLKEGRSFLFVPDLKESSPIHQISECVDESLVLCEGYEIPLPANKNPELTKKESSRVTYFWPKDFWLEDQSARYASFDTSGQVMMFHSYYEDLWKGEENRYFGFFMTLYLTLFFIQFSQNYLEKIGAPSGKIYFWASDVKGRKLNLDDRRYFFREWGTSQAEKIEADLFIKRGDSVYEKTIELGQKLFFPFSVSGDLKANMGKTFVSFAKEALIKLKIPFPSS